MPLEHFKTQVLLLHSEQSALDSLSAGFNDRFTVHCATSGSEALTTLGQVAIHVMVSAQRLPGMSGLDALREARKRSPDTIGILLAGDEGSDVEALVGDKDMFKIVSERVTPESLRKLIEDATQQARLLALARSANDTTADPDEVEGEHIVMETAENGATIVSDGTGRYPILNTEKVAPTPSVGARAVELLVLSQDDEFVKTISESTRNLHTVRQAASVSDADAAVRDHKIGVAVLDTAVVGSKIDKVALHLRTAAPRLVAVVAGRREDGEMLMDLINRGKVYRFLLKPVSPGRARLAIEASVRHHLEAPDSAFRSTAPPTPAEVRPLQAKKTGAKPESKAGSATGPKPEQPKRAAAAAQPDRAEPKPEPIVAERDEVRPAGAAEVRVDRRPEPPPDVSASPGDALEDSAGDDSRISEAVTGIFKALGVDADAHNDADAAAEAGDKPAGMSSLFGPGKLGIAAAALVVVIGASWWLFGGSDDTVSDERPETDVTAGAEPVPQRDVNAVSGSGIDLDDLLRDARAAVGDGRIYDPAGGNAIELYLTAAASAPGVEQVETELAATIDRALGMAETALLERRMDASSAALDRVALADPDNPRLRFLRAQLADIRLRDYLAAARSAIRDSRFEDASRALASAKALRLDDTSEIDELDAELKRRLNDQRVEEVLEKARASLEAGDLVAPANDNAGYYYRLALSADPQNAAARQGLVVVAGKLVLEARAEMDRGDFDAAETLLADARRLDPESRELANADAALVAARERVERERREAQRLAAEKAAAERAAAERAEKARLAAQRAAAERARAERLAAELEAAKRAEAERLARERAAAQRAAAEKLAVDAPQPRRAESQPPARRPQAEPQSQPAAATTAEPRPQATQTAAARQPATAPTAGSQAQGQSVPDAASQTAAPPEPRTSTATVPVSSLTRTKYVAPRYPRAAQRRGLTGYVDVVFTVDIDGSVRDINVVASKPGDTFVSAALNAVEDWEFEPVLEGGVAVEKRAAVRMMFALE